jgi:transposase
MTQYKRVAIDTSKATFTLHGIDKQDRPTLRINLRRAQMMPFFKKLPLPKSPWKRAAARIIGLTN